MRAILLHYGEPKDAGQVSVMTVARVGNKARENFLGAINSDCYCFFFCHRLCSFDRVVWQLKGFCDAAFNIAT